MPAWLAVQGIKAVLFLTLYVNINGENTFELSTLYLSRATAIFVMDFYQFSPSWIFGLKMELMTCADLVGSTTDQVFLFPDLTCYYQ